MFLKLDKFASMITFSHISCFSKNAWTAKFKSTSQKKCKLCFVSRVSFKWKVHFAKICFFLLSQNNKQRLCLFNPLENLWGTNFVKLNSL